MGFEVTRKQQREPGPLTERVFGFSSNIIAKRLIATVTPASTRSENTQVVIDERFRFVRTLGCRTTAITGSA